MRATIPQRGVMKMPVNEIVSLTPHEQETVVAVAQALEPFEKEIALAWHQFYVSSKTLHQSRERSERNFQHAVWLLLTSLRDGNFTGYFRRVQKTGAAFAKARERYDNLLIFFHFFEESIAPYLKKCFPRKNDHVRCTLEHLYHGIIGLMSRTYFKTLEKNHERFLSALIHDLRNPLIGVTGFAQLMVEKPLPEQKKIKFLKIIKQSGEKVSGIIDHALTYGSLKNCKIFLKLSDADVVEVCKEAATVLLPEIEQKCFTFTINRKKPESWGYLPSVRTVADRELLFRAVGNYFSNAVKHAKKKISVLVRERKENVVITVRDDGRGIPKDKVACIFDEYYVIPGDNKGIGIGLANVKMIAEIHKGKVWVESDYGKGCAFHLMLPKKQDGMPVAHA